MAVFERAVGYGLLADRPTAGAPGALYFASDTGQAFRDNGITWDELNVGARRTIIHATEDITLERANCLVLVDVDDLSITLPAALDNQGLQVTIRMTVAGDFGVNAPLTDNLVDTSHRPYTVIAAGDTWYQVDY